MRKRGKSRDKDILLLYVNNTILENAGNDEIRCRIRTISNLQLTIKERELRTYGGIIRKKTRGMKNSQGTFKENGTRKQLLRLFDEIDKRNDSLRNTKTKGDNK